MARSLPSLVVLTLCAIAAHARSTKTGSEDNDAKEVLVFTTGYDGPIDNADSWRYFDFDRITTVVTMGGGVPPMRSPRVHAV